MIHPFRHLRWEGQRHQHHPCTTPDAAGHDPGSATITPTSIHRADQLTRTALSQSPHHYRDPYAGGRRS